MSAATGSAEAAPSSGRAAGAEQPLSGLGRATGLMVRRLRVQACAWVLPLWALAAATPSYESVYPSLQSRTMLIEAMRASAGTRLLYGILPLPGTIGQLAQWEIGTYLVVCTGLMAVLLTCRTLRADEDEGLVELLRGAGAGRRVPFLAPVGVVTGIVALHATGIGLLMTILTGRVEELTVSGAWALAGTVAVVGWAFTGVSAMASQLAHDAASARGLSLSALGAALALRVVADETDASWLRWLSPVAWRDLIEPYTRDRWAVLAVCAVASLALVAAAGAIHARREYLDGYLPDRSASRRRWRVRGHADLLAHLDRRPLAAWAVAATCVSALFGAMSGSITDLLRPGSPTAQMVDRMAGGSPVVQFMGRLTVFTVLLVVVAAVGRAGSPAGDERHGLVEAEVAAGVSRTRLFVVRACATLIEAVALLLVSGGVLAATTAGQITEDHAVARAFVYTVSQLPGVFAAIGLALALVGLAPRRVALVWAVVAWSVFTQFFGGLVELPDRAQDLSVIGHYLDVVGPIDWKPLAIQAAVGLVGATVGLLAYRRRDLGA
jgi:ABC-transporter permease protein